ncbi:Peptidase M16 inactive domain protein [Roseivivax sp. THAF40]|uniref:M16 family metallopeptidase n=1 Tax=unclassified Roseivivax TaxID=2639302 RepID=UPI0012698191|nr:MULTISPECIES: pitrilysin family protein [unclassified Roseivivax]QFS84512.1 Peptidase M16 inactive domain protein [Roseivivax sp. THAF197b]QFT48340.1 Peptidase M16 inactive domain protein [Roseivivax sp. THAF40]
MRCLAAACAALFAWALPVSAQSLDDAVTTFTLDNGMDVVVIEDHRAPVVTHMVWYKAGAADEEPGVSGVAHFLEHLLFKGTETMEPGEFSKVVAANGGSDNAFTSYDYTGYFQRIASDRLGLMMQMEADRMVNLQLDGEDILTERDVIIEERNQRVENSPGALFGEERNAALYLNHPYGTPIIGWKHEAEALTLEDALAYYERFYAPNNAILIVAGDVYPDEVRALAEEHYGPLPANPDLTERARPQEPPQAAPRRLTYRDPRVAQPYVIRTYLAPERDPGAQEDAAALTLLAEILGGGQTSVLTRELQFEQQLAVYSGAFYSGTAYDDTSFGLIVVPQEGVSLAEAEAAMDASVAQFLEDGVDPEQLERIKFQLRADQVFTLDNSASLGRRYGSALTSGLTVEDVQAWPDILQAVTGEEIVAAARKVFDRNKSVTGWLMGPETAATPASATEEVTQ